MDLSHLNPDQLAAATKTAVGLLGKVAEYIGLTQPELDKKAADAEGYARQAHTIAGQLAAQGIIAHSEVTKTAEYLVADPANALELVGIVAERSKLASADISGQPLDTSGAGPAPSHKLNPFEKLALFGDSRADVDMTSATGAMIDG